MKVYIYVPGLYAVSGKLVVIANNKEQADQIVKDYLGIDTLDDFVTLDSIKDISPGVIIEYKER